MWGMWQKTANWQDKLHRRAAHKALNIPEEDVITSTNISHNGVGWKELAILALGGAAAFLGWTNFTGDQEEPKQVAPVVQPHQGWEVIVTDPGVSKTISTEEVTWESSSSQ